jgi:hypothetical protein
MVAVTPQFLNQVMIWANKIARDIAANFPKGDAFEKAVSDLLHRIDVQGNGIENIMTAWRAELRREPTNITSTGVHWSWHADSAAVYHHDNAYDALSDGESRDDLVEVVIEADVRFQSIDWPYTVATNLIHPAEREITVKSGSRVNVTGLYVGEEEVPFELENVPVFGSYP